MNYVIDKKRKLIVSQHETRAACRTYIHNVAALFNHDPANYIIAEGAKERDAKLKELKNAS